MTTPTHTPKSKALANKVLETMKEQRKLIVALRADKADLLAALRRLLEHEGSMFDHPEHRPGETITACRRRILRAAIAKAEGSK